MMIPYGYKQTEVGVIPEDWSVDTIGAVTLSVTNGGNYKNSAQISLYPLIKMGNISRGYINLKKIEYVIGFPPSENDRLTYGDVLLNTRNTPELVGKVAIWKNELSRAYFNSNLLRFNFKLEKSDPFFMNLIFNTEQVISEFRNIAKGTTSVAAIYPQDMLKVKIIIPPLQEQQRIAEALSDVDGMISSLEKLIAKYKSIKTACLQRMFPQNGETVPRMRLPGFTGAWEQRKLGEVIRLNGRIGFRGYTEKDIVSKDDGGVLTFSPTNIVDNKLTTNCKNTYITRFKYDESPEIKIHNGDILFVKTGSTLGKSALVTGLSEDATLNPQVVVMRTNNLNVEFLAAMLVTNAIISQVNSAKIGGAVPTLTETRIKDFDVAIPVSEAEKEQIGQFFSQLGHLITLHQRKLEKIQKIKQGMMQQLLTGKIRLK